MKNPIWEGIYNNFSEVNREGKGFSGELWVKNSCNKIEKIKQSTLNGDSSKITGFRESILPVIAGMVMADQGFVKILDFGGGMGFTFYPVYLSLPDKKKFEYHIVEVFNVCESGKSFYEGIPEIKFHSVLPQGNFDIVNMGSSLQYIEDWKGMLNTLARYKSQYFLLSDLPAGNIPTYVTVQNYYDSKIPVWFFNVSEIIDTLTDLNYQLILKVPYISNILGLEQPYPQENLEKKYRIGYPLILLFKMKNDFWKKF